MKQTQNSGNSACKFSISPGFARLKNLLSTKRARTITAMFAFFASLLSLCFLQNPSFASLLRTPATYLNISTSTPNVDFQFNQSELSSSAFKTNNVAVNIQTDNATGATTYISSIDEATSLVHSDSGVSDSIASISTPLLSTAFTGKTWGYRVGSLATTAFNPIPKASAPSEIQNTNSPSPVASTISVNFGVKADPTLPSGAYSKQILFTTVTNKIPVTATFKTGFEFSSAVKGLNPSGNTKYFKHSNNPPANLSDATVVSTPDSATQIYAWYDTGSKTVYWWSDADIAYANEDASSMFSNINGFSSGNHIELIDTRGINTSKTKDMSRMFAQEQGTIKKIILDGMDTSNVEDMSYMFFKKSTPVEYTEAADFSSFDTSKVTNMEYMFNNTTFKTLNISNFNTSNVVNMEKAFSYITGIKELDLSNLDVKKVANATELFRLSTSIEKLNLSGWKNNLLTDMSDLFRQMTSLKELNLTGFTTPNVTNMSRIFLYCESLEEVDLSSFDTSNVTDMSSMFNGTKKLSNIVFGNFDTRRVTNMNSMFSMSMQDVANAQLDLSAFDTQSLQDASRMFFSSGVKTIYVSSNFQTNTIINSSMMFDGGTNLVGGNGTTYSPSNPKDKTYARIDAPGAPGYFTQKP